MSLKLVLLLCLLKQPCPHAALLPPNISRRLHAGAELSWRHRLLLLAWLARAVAPSAQPMQLRWNALHCTQRLHTAGCRESVWPTHVVPGVALSLLPLTGWPVHQPLLHYLPLCTVASAVQAAASGPRHEADCYLLLLCSTGAQPAVPPAADGTSAGLCCPGLWW